MRRVREKRHRLPDAAYHGRKTVSFTACVERRRPLYRDPEVVRAFVEILAEQASLAGCLVPIYCFMPDHMHVMIQGLEETSRPKVAMDEFKSGAGLWLARHRPDFELQKDYHDRIVRAAEDWRAHAFYVFQNPLRAGLVDDPYAYPFTGSVGYDLVEMLHDVSW
jgi:putative transposase